jgi:carbonic anhydrase
MKMIVEGVKAFHKEHFHDYKELFELLARGQNPRYLFITCSDSRIIPHFLTGLGPGEVFTIRNAGNIVPPATAGPTGEAASIEYAVSVLKVRHAIVCGHSKCGAVTGLMNPESLDKLPSVSGFLRHSEAVYRTIKTRHAHLQGDEMVLQAVKENVLLQLKHMKTLPSVAGAMSRKELDIHGWVFMIETGEILAHDASSRQFIPVEQWFMERC